MVPIDVGAKHLGDQFCYSTKIFISEYFALAARGEGEAFVKINPGLVPKSGHECFAPTEFCMKGITQNQFANNIFKLKAVVGM